MTVCASYTPVIMKPSRGCATSRLHLGGFSAGPQGHSTRQSDTWGGATVAMYFCMVAMSIYAPHWQEAGAQHGLMSTDKQRAAAAAALAKETLSWLPCITASASHRHRYCGY